jgi:hypothetical protein
MEGTSDEVAFGEFTSWLGAVHDAAGCAGCDDSRMECWTTKQALDDLGFIARDAHGRRDGQGRCDLASFRQEGCAPTSSLPARRFAGFRSPV